MSPPPRRLSNAGLAQVEADGCLAQGKKDRGDEPTEPHVYHPISASGTYL